MQGVKLERLQNEIKEHLIYILQREIENPKIRKCTITEVKLSNELSFAKVFFTTLKKEELKSILENLTKAKGFIRTKLAQKLTTYKTPNLIFVIDESIEKYNEIEKVLYDIRKNK